MSSWPRIIPDRPSRCETTSEYTAFGYPTDHRVGRFEEAIAIIGPLVRGEHVTLAGSYYQVHDALCVRHPTGRSQSWSRRRVGACFG
jgi:alkanesulfonate monooxygenase SsuD/methylene tetrahydromethanopterin reductase-like flavin-dependent oxidoreductase (luciferase family)